MSTNLTAEQRDWLKATIEQLETVIGNSQGLETVSCATQMQALHSYAVDLDFPPSITDTLKAAWIHGRDDDIVPMDALIAARDQLKKLFLEPAIASAEVEEDLDEVTLDVPLHSIPAPPFLSPPATDEAKPDHDLHSLLEGPPKFDEGRDVPMEEDEGPQLIDLDEEGTGLEDWMKEDEVQDRKEEDPDPPPRRWIGRISQRAMMWTLGVLSVIVLLGGGSYCVANPNGKLATMWSAHQMEKLAAQPVTPFPCGSDGLFTSKSVNYQVVGGFIGRNGNCVWLPPEGRTSIVDRGCLPGLQSGYACPEVIRTFTCGSEGQFTSKGVNYQVTGATSDEYGTCVLLETGVAIDHGCLFGSMPSEKCPAVKPVH
jgi:hypothetical protein